MTDDESEARTGATAGQNRQALFEGPREGEVLASRPSSTLGSLSRHRASELGQEVYSWRSKRSSDKTMTRTVVSHMILASPWLGVKPPIPGVAKESQTGSALGSGHAHHQLVNISLPTREAHRVWRESKEVRNQISGATSAADSLRDTLPSLPQSLS